MRWGGPRAWAGASVACLVLLGALPDAEAANPDFDRGRLLFRQVEYERAIVALQAALRSGSLSREEKIEAYLLLAKANRALDRPGDAAAAFRSLLRIDPEFRLSPARESPSLIELFERVRRELERPARVAPPVIRHTPVKTGYAGLGVTLQAEIQNLRTEHRPRLHYRRIGQLRYQTLDFVRRSGTQFLATIPGSALEAQPQDYLVEYYLTVTDSLGEVVAGSGSDEKPLSFRVVQLHRRPAGSSELTETPSWHRRYWWVWVTVGVVVVGGVVGGLAAR